MAGTPLGCRGSQPSQPCPCSTRFRSAAGPRRRPQSRPTAGGHGEARPGRRPDGGGVSGACGKGLSRSLTGDSRPAGPAWRLSAQGEAVSGGGQDILLLPPPPLPPPPPRGGARARPPQDRAAASADDAASAVGGGGGGGAAAAGTVAGGDT